MEGYKYTGPEHYYATPFEGSVIPPRYGGLARYGGFINGEEEPEEKSKTRRKRSRGIREQNKETKNGGSRIVHPGFRKGKGQR